MHTTYYRLIDLDTDSIVANGIHSLVVAEQTLRVFALEYPKCKFEIQTYNKP